jgi:hypothetical protein
MPATRPFAPIVVVALLAWLAVCGSAEAHGQTLCLGPGHGCFKSLQSAVDAARDGTTIAIAPGTYRGGVVVARSVRLAGSGPGRTIIRGGGPVLTLAGATSVSGLTITGGVTSTNPRSPECAPDVPVCGPGYADATALGGGIEALPGSTVTLLRTVVAGNRSAPAHTVPSVRAVCPDGPCPASFGDAAGIDNCATTTPPAPNRRAAGSSARQVPALRSGTRSSRATASRRSPRTGASPTVAASTSTPAGL